jgi:type I restriction enzyme M protein
LAIIEQVLDEKREEQGGEEGLLAEVVEGEGDKQTLTAKAVKARLKTIGKDPDYADERAALTDYSALLERQVDAKAKINAAREALEETLHACYGALTEDEVRTLVVDDKWIATLAAAVQDELNRISQTLTGRIHQLAARYATPLPQLNEEVEALSARVAGHLKKMGTAWN